MVFGAVFKKLFIYSDQHYGWRKPISVPGPSTNLLWPKKEVGMSRACESSTPTAWTAGKTSRPICALQMVIVL